MAFTLLAAEGGEVGDSLVEPDRFDEVRAAARDAPRARRADRAAARTSWPRRDDADGATHDRCPADAIPAGLMGLDIGPETVERVRRDRSPTRRRSCGTARWACSSSSRSRPARAGVATAVADGRRVHASSGGGDSLLAVKRRPGSRTRSTTCRPAAAPRSSSSRAARCPASRSWRTRTMTATGGRSSRPTGRCTRRTSRRSRRCRSSATCSTTDDAERVEVVICPPFTALRSVADADRRGQAAVRRSAPRTCYPEDEGAFTGEVSPPMLAALKVGYVIVGHSERRQLFGEDDAVVNRKVRAVFEHGMTPILCVGETLEERDADGTETKVDPAGPPGVRRASTPTHAATAVVAYEPIWAIGTGRNAEPARRRPGGRGDPRRPGRALRRRRGRRRSGSSTAAASSRATSASSWPTPRSTARWSAARASTPRTSR